MYSSNTKTQSSRTSIRRTRSRSTPGFRRGFTTHNEAGDCSQSSTRGSVRRYLIGPHFIVDAWSVVVHPPAGAGRLLSLNPAQQRHVSPALSGASFSSRRPGPSVVPPQQRADCLPAPARNGIIPSLPAYQVPHFIVDAWIIVVLPPVTRATCRSSPPSPTAPAATYHLLLRDRAHHFFHNRRCAVKWAGLLTFWRGRRLLAVPLPRKRRIILPIRAPHTSIARGCIQVHSRAGRACLVFILYSARHCIIRRLRSIRFHAHSPPPVALGDARLCSPDVYK
ncbi:hypothetical protein AVEN_267653-1 [Araneus ventricosus]|uniref:Uncharacterized protein n=1 Tax=Araneus ventricosus TaxID=182803 RepID=A0A4Y2PHR3_ARAVE|nr:hypothetical protein AVEN_267653-1 [Araneus ventricosus]